MDPQYVEQPLVASDLSGMNILRRRTDVPIASDESSSTLNDVQNVIKQEAADVIIIDARKLGGLWICKKAAAAAEAAGFPVVMHTSGELGIAISAFGHVLVSTPNFTLSNQTLYQYLSGDVITNKMKLEAGLLRLNNNKGLGVEVNKNRLSHFGRLLSRKGAPTHYEPLEMGRVPVPTGM